MEKKMFSGNRKSIQEFKTHAAFYYTKSFISLFLSQPSGSGRGTKVNWGTPRRNNVFPEAFCSGTAEGWPFPGARLYTLAPSAGQDSEDGWAPPECYG